MSNAVLKEERFRMLLAANKGAYPSVSKEEITKGMSDIEVVDLHRSTPFASLSSHLRELAVLYDIPPPHLFWAKAGNSLAGYLTPRGAVVVTGPIKVIETDVLFSMLSGLISHEFQHGVKRTTFPQSIEEKELRSSFHEDEFQADCLALATTSLRTIISLLYQSREGFEEKLRGAKNVDPRDVVALSWQYEDTFSPSYARRMQSVEGATRSKNWQEYIESRSRESLDKLVDGAPYL